jgi:phage terminase small subunit
MQIEQARSRGIDTSSYENCALIDIDKPLTDQQKAFVRHWAAGESPLNASARAGYADNGKYAYRLMRYPNVLKLYNAEKEKYEASVGMTRKKVMEGLIEGIEMAKLAGEPASMIAGWREVGKMCGYYEPTRRTIDINVNGSVELDRMNRLTDAELLRFIEGGGTTTLELLERTDD